MRRVVTRLDVAELPLLDGLVAVERDERVERLGVLPAMIRLVDGLEARELRLLIAPLLDLLKLKARELRAELLIEELLRDGVLRLLMLGRDADGLEGLDTLCLPARELPVVRDERLALLEARALPALLERLRLPSDTGPDANTTIAATANIAIKRPCSCLTDDMMASFL